MKNNIKYLFFYILLTLLTSFGSYAARPSENSPHTSCQSFSKKNNESVREERKNTRLAKHEIKEKLKEFKKNKGKVDPFLMIILAIFLPPLAVYLLEDLSTNFWIDLLLTLLFFVPGMVYALYLVLKDQGVI